MKWLLLAILALIWGSSFILIKHSVHDDSGMQLLSAWQVGAGRIVIAGLALLPFTIGKWHLVKDRKTLLGLSVSAIFGNLIPSFLFATAETSISSSLAGILNATVPLFTILISVVVLRQRMLTLQWIGLVVGFLSVVMIMGGDLTGDVRYAMLIPVATLCYAISMLTIKHLLGHLKPLQITSLSFSIGMIPASVVLLFTDVKTPMQHPEFHENLFYLVILAVVGTAVAIILFNRLIQLTEPLFTSMVTYLIPIVAICWGVVDGERLTWIHFLGVAGILSGVLMVSRRPRKR